MSSEEAMDPSLSEDPISEDPSLFEWVWSEVTGSYLNIVLTLAIVYLIYKILFPKEEVYTPPPPQPAPLKPQDMTLEQLKKYDGVHADGDGHVCMAVLGTIFDVTRGKRFYGPGGPYSAFAGRDASRGLATFDVAAMTDRYDDLSDLKPDEMEQVKDWHSQFSEKYTVLGKLIQPGEESSQKEAVEEPVKEEAGEALVTGEDKEEDEDDYAKSFKQ